MTEETAETAASVPVRIPQEIADVTYQACMYQAAGVTPRGLWGGGDDA